MRVLVTGGAGFIGSHIVDQLVGGDHEVVVVDRRPAVRDDVVHLEGDIRDRQTWMVAARGVDAVCHQASRVGLGVDFRDVCHYVADNDGGTAAGLWALHQLGFRGRLVLASSMVVYGEGRYRCEVHGDVTAPPRRPADLDRRLWDPRCDECGQTLAWAAVDESAPTDPRNVYAATKLHQEHLCASFGREHDVSVASLRYHNVYGPRMPRDTPYAGVASLFQSALARGEPPRVFEDGGQTRDFVHVYDVARANVLALTRPDPVRGAFNVASGQPRTVLEMAAALADNAGGPDPVVVGGYRLGDVRHIVASPRKAAVELGFEASMPFREGIRELSAA